MDNSVSDALKIIFLLGFTLHNIEEAIWLPRWSQSAGKFHRSVEQDSFIFAVLVITVIGYILTVLDLLVGSAVSFSGYIYLGFLGMMGINSLFPHLISTFFIKKYAPGLLTGIFLNLPLSIIIIFSSMKNGYNLYLVLLAVIVVSMIILFSLNSLFRLGRFLIRFPD